MAFFFVLQACNRPVGITGDQWLQLANHNARYIGYKNFTIGSICLLKLRQGEGGSLNAYENLAASFWLATIQFYKLNDDIFSLAEIFIDIPQS